jgi:DNA-binding LacI/PurR family transcriptional regulator/anti-anti-sigma regulatory factor
MVDSRNEAQRMHSALQDADYVSSRRLTIGYLAPNISDSVSLARWHGVLDMAQEQDINLICFPGWYWRDPRPGGQANVIYDLIDSENLDGIVLGNIVQESSASYDEFRDFYERHFHVPVVSMRKMLDGVPYVPLDNYQGMREVMVHLIEVHGYHRIAFMRGPEKHPYAQERYRAYMDVLEEYGLPFDLALVTPPSGWDAPAIHVLLDERGLSPAIDFEAVVAVNDRKALDALTVLQTRGVQVPKDVGVVGFNDDAQDRVFTPPLTSVAMPFYEQGRRLVEMVLALLKGEKIPERVALPSRLIVRQSCGCMTPAMVQAAAEPSKTSLVEIETTLTAHRGEILAEMVQEVGDFVEASAWVERLLDAFVAALTAGGDPRGAFLFTLNEILCQVAAEDGDVTAWQGAISALRRHLLPSITHQGVSLWAGGLWHQARVMIGETAERMRMRQMLQAKQWTQTLREVSAALITTFDVTDLMEVLAENLPRMDIPGAFLSLYEDSQAPAEWSRLVLAYTAEGRIALAAPGIRFSSRRLIPEGMWPQKRYTFVVKPLYFQERQIGFSLFEVGPRDGGIYEALRGEISSALQGALLSRERQQATQALDMAYAAMEKLVEERTAELRREVTERLHAQDRAVQELSMPIIPVMDAPQGGIIVVPLVGDSGTLRVQDIVRRLPERIQEHQAQVVILDVTDVLVADDVVTAYLGEIVQVIHRQGAQSIIAGASAAVAEAVAGSGEDLRGVETVSDLRTGLRAALNRIEMLTLG